MTIFSGCAKNSEKKPDVAIENMSFRDIPGITQREIAAIENLLKKHEFFVYGIMPSTEAFIN
jgi:hypothetical protein